MNRKHNLGFTYTDCTIWLCTAFNCMFKFALGSLSLLLLPQCKRWDIPFSQDTSVSAFQVFKFWLRIMPSVPAGFRFLDNIGLLHLQFAEGSWWYFSASTMWAKCLNLCLSLFLSPPSFSCSSSSSPSSSSFSSYSSSSFFFSFSFFFLLLLPIIYLLVNHLPLYETYILLMLFHWVTLII
jgi:hypothetical protein